MSTLQNETASTKVVRIISRCCGLIADALEFFPATNKGTCCSPLLSAGYDSRKWVQTTQGNHYEGGQGGEESAHDRATYRSFRFHALCSTATVCKRGGGSTI